MLDPLAAIRRFESGGQNILQRAVPPGGGYNPSTGTITGPSTAQGYYQITNDTWRKIPGNITQGFPNAMAAPYSVQTDAASYLYNTAGFSPWAPYNNSLRNYISAVGGESAFTPPGSLHVSGDTQDNTDPTVVSDIAPDTNTTTFTAPIPPDTTTTLGPQGDLTTIDPETGQTVPRINMNIVPGAPAPAPTAQGGTAAGSPTVQAAIDAQTTGQGKSISSAANSIGKAISGVGTIIAGAFGGGVNALEDFLIYRAGVVIIGLVVLAIGAYLLIPHDTKVNIAKNAAAVA